MYLNVLKKRDKQHHRLHSPSKPFPNLLCQTQAPLCPSKHEQGWRLVSKCHTEMTIQHDSCNPPFISTLGFFLTSPIIIHRISFSSVTLHFLCSDYSVLLSIFISQPLSSATTRKGGQGAELQRRPSFSVPLQPPTLRVWRIDQKFWVTPPNPLSRFHGPLRSRTTPPVPAVTLRRLVCTLLSPQYGYHPYPRLH